MTPSPIKTNGINIAFQSGGRTECDKGIKLDKVKTHPHTVNILHRKSWKHYIIRRNKKIS